MSGAVMLEKPREELIFSWTDDLLDAALIAAGEWDQIAERLELDGVPQNARNNWVNLINDDPRGLSQDGLTLATFTTSAPYFPAWVLPLNFWKTGRMMKIKATGVYGATGTPTFTHRLQQTAPAAVTVVTGAANAVTALTNRLFIVELTVQGRSEGTGGTVQAQGTFEQFDATYAKFGLPAAGTAPAPATVDTTVQETWQLEAACSASSASNTVKGLSLEVFSLN